VRQLRRGAVTLVLEELIRAEVHPLGERLRGDGFVERVGHGFEQCRRDARDLGRPAGQRGTRPAEGVGIELLGIADADEHDGLGAQLPERGHREGLAALPAEVGFFHEVREVATECPVEGVGTGSETAIREHGNGEEVGARLVGGGGTGFDRERHGPGVYGFRGKFPTA
jgi:hypothetical protein